MYVLIIILGLDLSSRKLGALPGVVTIVDVENKTEDEDVESVVPGNISNGILGCGSACSIFDPHLGQSNRLLTMSFNLLIIINVLIINLNSNIRSIPVLE